MLGDHPIEVVLLAADLQASKDFYAQKVGLEIVREQEDAVGLNSERVWHSQSRECCSSSIAAVRSRACLAEAAAVAAPDLNLEQPGAMTALLTPAAARR